MKMSDVALELRSAVAKILNGLMADCAQVQTTTVHNKWLGEKIGQLVECNLLTYQEIDSLFGWQEKALRFHRYHLEPSTNANTLQLTAYEILNRVCALIGVVAAKYRLNVTFATEVPQVAETKEVPVSLVVVQPPVGDRYDLLYTPLKRFPVFSGLSVRAMSALKNAGVEFLGDLARYTEQELRHIVNVGKVSVIEIKVALDSLPFGLSLGCLTPEEQSEFDARKWLNENAETPLCAHHCYGFGEEWQAPHALLQELHQLGITERTELATCPLDVLAPFLASKGDLKRMLNPHGSSNLGLAIPRHLKSNVRVYTHVSGEDSPETSE